MDYKNKIISSVLKIRKTFSLDLRSLALFRICLASVLIYDLLDRMRNLTDHYTDLGVLPRGPVIESVTNFWEWSLHFSFGHPLGIFLLFLVTLGVYFCMLVGYRTRLASFLSWVLLVSLQTRNPMVLQGGDELLKMLLLWSVFLPTGHYFSLDKMPLNLKNRHHSMAAVGLISQILILYIFAGLYKLAERQWLGGEALYLAFSAVDLNTPLSRIALQTPSLVKYGTYATLFFEILLPLLILSPWRNAQLRIALATFFVFFHISVFLTFNVGIFVTVPMVMWIALLPSEIWDHTSLKLWARKIETFFTSMRSKLKISDSYPKNRQWISSLLAPIVFILVLTWNVTNLPGGFNYFSEPLRPLIYGATLQQAFGMFSVTLSRSGYLWIPGITETGDKVELTSTGEVMPLRTHFPLSDRTNNPNDRWGKLTESVVSNVSDMRSTFGKYLCRKWNEDSGKKANLDVLKIYFVHHKITKAGVYEGPFFEELWTHECFEGLVDKWQSKLDCLYQEDERCKSVAVSQEE